MTQEEKDLLLKDLCARLPYGVKVQVPQRISINPLRVYAIEQVYKSTFYCERNGWLCKFWNETFARIFEVKPYLRPMSSMTEEERDWYKTLLNGNIGESIIKSIDNTINWLNANHFDYHGIIPMGLALPAPEGMYD